MKSDQKNVEFRKRLLMFSVNTIKFLNTVPGKKEFDVIRYQLSKSATAIGANYEESQNTTYREFAHKVKIALREASETKYWLRILEELAVGNADRVRQLTGEVEEIIKILGAIASKTGKHQ